MASGHALARTGLLLRTLALQATDDHNHAYFLAHLALRDLDARGCLDRRNLPCIDELRRALATSLKKAPRGSH